MFLLPEDRDYFHGRPVETCIRRHRIDLQCIERTGRTGLSGHKIAQRTGKITEEIDQGLGSRIYQKYDHYCMAISRDMGKNYCLQKEDRPKKHTAVG